MEDRTESTALVSLKKRLATGDLTVEDRVQLERTVKLRSLREMDKTFEECAVEMGEKETTLSAFARRPTYEAICAHLDTVKDSMDERSMERAVRRGRIDSASLIPYATTYLRDCFKVHPPGTMKRIGGVDVDVSGKLVADDKAMWATEQLKGTGFLAPVNVVASKVQNATFINQTIFVSRGDDDQAAKSARAVAIDVTPEAC